MLKLPDEPLLMIFVKYPEPGRVKTRIAVEVGNEKAALIYREMVKIVLDRLPEDQKVRILYDSFRPETDYRSWLSHAATANAEYYPQSTGDLGERLGSAFKQAFADDWQKVGVIGSDCMELTSEIYQSAWETLKGNDVVLGPTFDGGYYFLAMQYFEPRLFANITWSSEAVLQETLRAAENSKLRVGLLEKLHDIDNLQDWQAANIVS